MNHAELMASLTDISQRVELLKRAVQAQDDPGLYVRRRLLPVSAAAFIRWAADEGFTNLTPPDDLHVTVVHSRKAIPWQSLASHVVVEAPHLPFLRLLRTVMPLGDKGAVVLMFRSAALHARWDAARRAGAIWDYAGYRPHVTITYQGSDVDLAKVKPFDGMLELGPEVQGPVDDTWAERLKVLRATS